MNEIKESDLREYLLGQVSEEQRDAIEREIMTSPRFTDALRAAEDDLSDEYAAGSLRGTEKESFERIFLAHPSRRRQLAFSAALQRYVTFASQALSARLGFFEFFRKQNLFFKTAVAVASVAVMVGSSWLGLQTWRLRRDVNVLTVQQQNSATELEQERNRRMQAEVELSGLRGAAAQRAAWITLSVSPGLVRDSGSVPRIRIPQDVGGLRLELLLENAAYAAYNATLQNGDGDLQWSQKRLSSTPTAAGDAVVAIVGNSLSPDDYVLQLEGIRGDGSVERAGSYYFRIVKP